MSIQTPVSGDITPSQLTAGTEMKTLRRTTPIAHGAGVSYVFNDDNAIYDALRELWRAEVGEPGKKATIAEADIDFNSPGEYVWIFFSSGYKAGAENQYGNWKQWHKYHLMLRRVERDDEGNVDSLKKPPTSVHAVIEPQKEGMTYDPEDNGGKLKEVDLPYGVGSRINVQTTYVERPSQVVRRGINAVKDALEVVGNNRLVDAGQLKRESCRVWKLETYLRFDIERKHALVRTIDKSENLIDIGGGAEIETFRQRQSEGWLKSRLDSDRWHLLGLTPAETTIEHEGGETERVGYNRELKVYQAGDWYEKPKTHWAHHPKIEASLGSGRNPHIDEWHDVLDRLRELTLTHAEWAGVTDDDLVGDPYFDPSTQPVYEFEHPEGRREDLQKYYNRFEAVIYSQCIQRQSYAAYDILAVIVERYGATYNELEAELGYSRSNLQYHVGRMVEMGLLATKGNPCIIGFASGKIMEIAEDAIERVGNEHEEETLGKRRIEREKRKKERIDNRENGESNGTHERDDPRDLGPESRGGDQDGEANRFVYLADWHGTPQMIMDQLVDEQHPRGEKDVRVRVLDDDPGDGTR